MDTWSDAAESNQGTSRKVVVVHTSNYLLPAGMLAEKAMRQALVAGTHDAIVFETEALNVLEQMDVTPQQEIRERERLASKYGSTKIDLIMPVASVALEFVERHRATIWPDVPVIYYGVSDRSIEGREFAPDIGGLTVHFDVSGTLQLAMQLQPEARRVVYVGGVAPYDKTFEPLFSQAMHSHVHRFQVNELIGLHPETLKRELARLPPDSIVLYTSMLMDNAGSRYVSADLLDSLSSSSSAPIYGIFSSYLGRGITGGSMIDFEQHGRRAGLLAARVLNGDTDLAEARLPHNEFPSTCMLDVRRLKHWSISTGLAPSECNLLFGPQPFWQAHREVLLLGAGAFILLTWMGFALRTQGNRRREAEQEATQRRHEALHAARLALMGEISASIVHEVTQPLSAILSNADAAEMLLQKESPSLAEIRAILTDIRRDDARAHEIVSRLRVLLKKGELNVSNIDPNELTASTLALIEPEARHRNVVVSASPEPALPAISGDAVHLQQAILNLLVNALDALDGVPPNERLLELRTSRHGTNAICISVRDSGRGIAPEVLPRIFESFCTTKRDGMGLGLSIAKAIVDAHGGALTADSASSRGTEFRLTLPAVSQALSAD